MNECLDMSMNATLNICTERQKLIENYVRSLWNCVQNSIVGQLNYSKNVLQNKKKKEEELNEEKMCRFLWTRIMGQIGAMSTLFSADNEWVNGNLKRKTMPKMC